MSLFQNEALLTIVLETENDSLASAEVTRILYKKPGGTEGYWDASVSGTKLMYALEVGDIDIVGVWSFQAYTETGGLPHFGTIATKQVQKPITVT